MRESTGADAVLGALEVPLCVLSSDGTIQRVNQQLRERTGRGDANLIGRDLGSLFSDDTLLHSGVSRVIETGDSTEVSTALLDADGETHPQKVRLIRGDGGAFVVAFAYDPDDSPTEREKSESALRSMYDVIADPELTFEEQVEALLDIGCETLDTRYGTLSHVKGDDYVFEVVNSETDAIEAGDTIPLSATVCERTVSTERRLVVGDLPSETPELAERDGPIEFDMTCYLGAPVVVDSDMYGTFCFYGDQSLGTEFEDWEMTLVDLMSRWVSVRLEQERTETDLRRQNERLERFASIVSHDLRGPLSVASGRLHMVADECNSDYIDDVAAAHDRIDELLSDILLLAREGDVVDVVDTVDLETVVNEAWRQVPADGGTLTVGETRGLSADESRLQQAFENLLRNALEHADDGVHIIVGTLPDGIYVQDDGPGLSDEEREDIFEPGYSSQQNGTGFGLTIVREIVEGHGWSIDVTESADGGARFEIRGIDDTASTRGE